MENIPKNTFRDCADLQSYMDLSRYRNLESPEDLDHWIYTNLIADELDELFRDEEEEEKTDSYFPYRKNLDPCYLFSSTAKVSCPSVFIGEFRRSGWLAISGDLMMIIQY